MQRLANESLTSQVYQALRASLMGGEFVPGQVLKVAEIAERAGTSATPVREALARLVSEGALLHQDRRSAKVFRLRAAEYREILQLRLYMEGTAAAKASKLASADDIDRLEQIHQSGLLAKREKRFADNLKANERFHLGVYALARMPIYYQMIEGLWLKIGPLLNEGQRHWPIYDPDHHPHWTVIRGLRERNGTVARSGIEDDLKFHGAAILDYLTAREAENPKSTGRDSGPSARLAQA